MAKKKTSEEKIVTTTKKYMAIILGFACLWISISYGIAIYAAVSCHTFTVLETLSKSICMTIVGTFVTYALKSYFETHSEKYNELIKGGYVQMEGVKQSEYVDEEVNESFFGNAENSYSDEISQETVDEDVSQTEDNEDEVVG